MKTILFQGDSITDAGHPGDGEVILGHGYALMTAGKIGCDYPGQFKMINRGVSGNRSTDLYARIKKDILNLKPDYMSILIGVNDGFREFYENDGTSLEKYRNIYDLLLTEVKEAIPYIKLILLEPFVLCGSFTKDFYEPLAADVCRRGEIVRELAQKHRCYFIPLQEKITNLAAQSAENAVLMDGIHPTFIGHELISRELYDVYRTIL